jgi:hypothetical protein
MAMRTHIGRSLRSTATAGNAPLQPLPDLRPKVSGGWIFAVRSVHNIASRCLTRGAVRTDWGIVNPMAWAVRTVDNQLEFGRLFDQQICHCGTL